MKNRETKIGVASIRGTRGADSGGAVVVGTLWPNREQGLISTKDEVEHNLSST